MKPTRRETKAINRSLAAAGHLWQLNRARKLALVDDAEPLTAHEAALAAWDAQHTSDQQQQQTA